MNRVLVAYASRRGATRGIAERITETLARSGLDVSMQPVDKVGQVEGFDAFVVGSSAYMGRWEKTAAEFVRRHAMLLGGCPVWLFSSGPIGPDRIDSKGRDQVAASWPQEFNEFAELIRPRDEKIFFGAYDPEHPGATFAERMAIKVPAIRASMPAGDFRDWPAIEAWAEGIARELTGLPAGAPTPA